MPLKAKIYVSAVIAAAAAILAVSMWNSAWPGPVGYGLFLLAAIASSVLKLRLPGLTGAYSFSFLVLLFGLMQFDAAPVLMAGAVVGLAQSVLNAKRRPQPIQVVFNVANLVVTLGACLAVWHTLLRHQVLFRPALLALVAALYFVINTGLVSGILSLLQGKRLSEVSEEWYFWAFPYFLIGSACLGLLPRVGERITGGEAWLIILPLLYLIHFFYGISTGNRPAVLPPSDNDPGKSELPGPAKAFVGIVTTLGVLLLAYSLVHWTCLNEVRFAAFAVAALMASIWKVRLPGVAGTISLSFVVMLVAIVELSWSETVVMCAAMGAMQSLWRPSRRKPPHQVLFNMFALVLSGSLAYMVCRWSVGSFLPLPVAILIPLAVVVAYASNSLLVSTVICLAEDKPLSRVWQHCYFWSLPYYLVGGVGAGMIIATLHAAGWLPSLMMAPLILLVYVSYRAHLSVAAQPKMSTA